MVDYDDAVQTVGDQNADPVMLARIAYENPEFGANVAANPRCYPGLKHWLATFGDERAKAYLAKQGFVDHLGEVAPRTTDRDRATDRADHRASAQPRTQGTHDTDYEQVTYEQPAYEAPVRAASPDSPGPQTQSTADPSAFQQAASQQPASPQATPQRSEHSFVSPERIMATNPYGFTARQALDPNTDPNTLAQIATYAPELWPCLAKNPNTYQALLDWLAGLNDPAVNAALASRG